MREDEVFDAIRKLDAGPLVAWIQDPSFDEDARNALLNRILRASSLINARRPEAQTKKLEKFKAALRDAFVASGGGCGDAFDTVVSQLVLAEEGYRRILQTLAASDYAKLDSATRIWSALSRAVEETILVRRQLLDQLNSQPSIMAQTLSLRDDQGRPVSVDALTDAFVEAAAASLNIEGRSEKWVEDDGLIIIPARVEAPDEARMHAGSNQYLSIAWRNWRGLEERVRFLGGRLKHRTRPDVPEGFPDDAEELFEAINVPDLFEIWVGQHRLNDGSAQSYLQTMNLPELKSRTVELGQGAPLTPKAWISHQEAVCFAALAGSLGQAVVNPLVLIEGLTVPEWLRGMAVLSALVSAPIRDEFENLDNWLPAFEAAELVEQLCQNGLSQPKAEIFIDEARFRTTSADLYDAPLIQCADGKLAAFGPALFGPNYAGILLSIFAGKDIEFSAKGTDFEDKVLDLLKGEGLLAVSYKTSRLNGETNRTEEYEFDVLLMWDDYLFVFECKNRSLPKNSAVLAYNFLRESRKQVRQVHRLCDSIRKWPEIVEQAFGKPLGRRTIVPIVLNNLPFAKSGAPDGVYFYDFQALNRFFDSRKLGFKSGRFDQETPIGQIDVVRIWRGDKPAARDLMEQLADPVQLRFNREQTRRDLFTFQLDETTIAAEQRLYREDITTDLAARIAGIPRHVMRDRERKLLKRSKKIVERSKRVPAGRRQ